MCTNQVNRKHKVLRATSARAKVPARAPFPPYILWPLPWHLMTLCDVDSPLIEGVGGYPHLIRACARTVHMTRFQRFLTHTRSANPSLTQTHRLVHNARRVDTGQFQSYSFISFLKPTTHPLTPYKFTEPP